MRRTAIQLSFVLGLTGSLLMAATPTHGAEPAAIPDQAIDAMGFFVGAWESEDFDDGVKTGTAVDRRAWAPGKDCLTMEMLISATGGDWHAAGVSGWDAKAQAVVEHWFTSRGDAATVSYPLAKMKENAWNGTFRFTMADGKSAEGECQLTKTAAGFEYVTRSQQDGKETVHKSVSRRVQGDISQKLKAPVPPSQNIPAKAREAMAFLRGQWEAENSQSGVERGPSVDQRRWAPGRYCLRVVWSESRNDARWRCAAIIGWDARLGAVVEYWYGNGGESLVNCYPLDKMQSDVWEGTFCFTNPDGASDEGTCRVTKTPQGFEYVSQWTKDGKEHTFKSVARRVEAKKPKK